MSSPGLVRTLRIRSRRKAGGLGVVTTALGDAGASIAEISTVRVGHNYTLRDFHLLLDDDKHLAEVLSSMAELADSEIVTVIDTVREVHRGGKVRTASRLRFSGVAMLSSAHTPGVREMVRAIDDEEALADAFTGAARTVALVSDGSGFTGLGKVEPRAILPVLEGKAALLAELAGLSSLPLALRCENEDAFVETLERIAPSYGAILLDSVVAPRGQRAALRLAELLKVPVIHDDADGPAIAGLAAVINACKRAGKDIDTVKIGQIGLGTAGGALARLVMKHTGRPVAGDDMHPAALSRHIANGGTQALLVDIMNTCDVVVANTGHAGVIATSMVREGQVIIALSEPRPEIEPYDAQLAGAAFAADGKAISTESAFPGVLLGAMAVKARTLNDDMRLAAARTLADCAEDGDIVPTPLADGVHERVAAAVARAAVKSGVAAHKVDDELLSPAVFRQLITGARHFPL